MGARSWLQGGLWGLALVAVGTLWAFPDALSRLRAVGAPYAAAAPGCDPSVGCTARFDDGVSVQLWARPQPAPPGVPVELRVTVDGPGVPLAVELQGADMAMGFLRLPLDADGDGWAATAQLPVCTTERMRWRADVVLEDRAAGFELWSTRDGAPPEGASGPHPSPPTVRPPTVDPAADATHGDLAVDTDAGPLRLSDLRGQVVVVYFGYTSCPDICPTTLQTMGQAFHRLDEADQAQLALLFVSVDPERDTPERLGDYARYFHERFHGGTAASEAVQRMATDWGVQYRKAGSPTSAMAYTVDHSTQAFLVGRDGQWLRDIPYGTPAGEVATMLEEALGSAAAGR